MENPINFQSKFDLFKDHWSPKVIAEMNDYQFKVVKIKGEFVWHAHEDTDEVFLVIDGSMNIEFEDRVVALKDGEMMVVKKGERHRPFAEEECKVLLIEPRGVVNTGDERSDLTAPMDVWL
jgi:mannose-6-phosphate isomerase-like protein (cupin superfamily)|tara:strand:+ start:3182 stop:3544 length:363 start_codon:yes stop_codon:yes gene_type:complete